MQPFVSRNRRLHDRNHLSRCRPQLLCHVGHCLIATRQVAFVDDDDIGNFQDSRLFPLQFIARLRLQYQHNDIGYPANCNFSLPGANRFDKNAVKSKRLHRIQHHFDVFRDALATDGRRQAADEDPLRIRNTDDSDAIPQQCAAASRGFLDRKQAHPRSPALGKLRRERTEQAALTRSATACHGDNRRSTLQSFSKRGRISSVHLPRRRQRQKSRQRSTIPSFELANQGFDVVGLDVRCHNLHYFAWLDRYSTIFSIDVPAPKHSSTPIALSLAWSAGDMIPPTITPMCVICRARSAASTCGTSVM